MIINVLPVLKPQHVILVREIELHQTVLVLMENMKMVLVKIVKVKIYILCNYFLYNIIIYYYKQIIIKKHAVTNVGHQVVIMQLNVLVIVQIQIEYSEQDNVIVK